MNGDLVAALTALITTRVEIEALDAAGSMVRLSLILTQDLQQVFGSVLPPLAATAEDMTKLLRQHNLQGIESSGLARMMEGSAGTRSARYWVRIAKGSAVDGLCGTHLLSDYLGPTEGDAVDSLHRALSTQSHVAVVEQADEVRATFIHPDQAMLDVGCQPMDVSESGTGGNSAESKVGGRRLWIPLPGLPPRRRQGGLEL